MTTQTTFFAENINQAWQTVLGQLQMEMPKASFDTWVRDTHPISYADGLFTVGVPSAYARDWLESRLASTASRLLIGLMNETVNVVFITAQIEQEDQSDVDEELEAEEKLGGHEIALANSTRYQEEVKPHRVIVFPGYALRLLAQGDLSPKELSLWIAFRQAAYFDWKKSGKGKATFSKNIPHQDVIRFAGMGRASFFRAINGKDELAGGMIRRLPDMDTGTFNPHLDNANRWQVSMSPRLARRDVAVIESILSADIALAEATTEARQAAALHTLDDLARRSPGDYLDVEIKTPKHAPAGIIEIVRRTLGLEEDIPAALFRAAEALQNKILGGYGSVVVTHHFLTEVVPALRLTQSQLWTAIVLRDRCYYDYETGEEHDFVMAPNGLASISAWTGVSIKSLSRWLDNPGFQQLVQLSKVEIPLEEHGDGADRLREWLNMGGKIIKVRKDEPPVGYIEDEHTGEFIPVWTKRYSPLDKVIPALGQSETHPETKCDSPLDKVRLGFGQSETLLNNLFKPLLNPFKPHKPQQTTSQALPSRKSSPAALPVVVGGWEMSALLALNPVSDPKLKTRLLEQGDPTAFVSWLLYAHSPDGQGITSPSSFAINSLGRDPRQGSKQTYVEIARQGPERLREFIDDLADPLSAGFHDDGGFARIFRKTPAHKLHDLEGCLFSHSLEILP